MGKEGTFYSSLTHRIAVENASKKSNGLYSSASLARGFGEADAAPLAPPPLFDVAATALAGEDRVLAGFGSLGASNSFRISPSIEWTRVSESLGRRIEVRKRVVT